MEKKYCVEILKDLDTDPKKANNIIISNIKLNKDAQARTQLQQLGHFLKIYKLTNTKITS